MSFAHFGRGGVGRALGVGIGWLLFSRRGGGERGDAVGGRAANILSKHQGPISNCSKVKVFRIYFYKGSVSE